MSWRSLLRVGAGGVVCALLVLAAGGLAQRFVLGADDAGMRVKVDFFDCEGGFALPVICPEAT